MSVVQIVIDTNMLVAALRSKLGDSHRLFSFLGDRRFETNVSVPSVLEYEQVGRGLIRTYIRTHPVAKALAKLYLPFARYRIEYLNARFPIETKVVKGLGLLERKN